MLTTQSAFSQELAEAVELVESLKKLPLLEQIFLKGYIQGMLARIDKEDEQKTA